MKKLTLLFGLLFLLSINSFANVSKYYVDDAQINAKFSSAVQITMPTSLDISSLALSTGTSVAKSGSNPIVAWVLCWCFGYIGIHRAYLGAPMMILWYTITCGGICGVVWAVDYILLFMGMINNDITKYEDNQKFFMW